MSVVIHFRAVIGKQCVIGQCVTIVGKNGWLEVPIIGDNVITNAGAKIIGPVRIGDNVEIGASCVVVKDVTSNCIVVVVTAKILRANMTKEDWCEMNRYKERGDGLFSITPRK